MTFSGGLQMPYRIYQDFLATNHHRAMLAWALDNEARFRPSRLSGRIVDESVRLSLSSRDLGPLEPVLLERISDHVPTMIQSLRVTPFVASDIELELVAHNDGAHFVLHSDVYSGDMGGRGDRMLSGVYYFFREPKAFWGGALRLHRFGAAQGDTAFTDVLPDQNTFVVFPSWGPHEVRPVSCPSQDFANSRFAVNCWVYRLRPDC